MLESLIFSGPQPTLTSDLTLSCLSSLNCWLWRGSPASDEGSVENWQEFKGRPGLIWTTLDGVALISRNLTILIIDPKPCQTGVQFFMLLCAYIRAIFSQKTH